MIFIQKVMGAVERGETWHKIRIGPWKLIIIAFIKHSLCGRDFYVNYFT